MAAFTVGDNSPDLAGTLTSDGAPVNITNASLAVHVRKPDRTVITLTGAIVDAAAGKWSAPWGASDLNQAGTWRVEVQVTFSGGTKVETFGPDYFTVNAQLA